MRIFKEIRTIYLPIRSHQNVEGKNTIGINKAMLLTLSNGSMLNLNFINSSSPLPKKKILSISRAPSFIFSAAREHHQQWKKESEINTLFFLLLSMNCLLAMIFSCYCIFFYLSESFFFLFICFLLFKENELWRNFFFFYL